MAYRITDANVRKKGFSKSSRESVPIGGATAERMSGWRRTAGFIYF
ncbi:MAG: hypothetical protein ACLR23_12960 [Clostridia bacterium]